MKEVQKVNLSQKLESFSEYWNPKIVGALNNQLVKVAKFHGEFVRHKHDHEDELFLVIKGKLEIVLDDRTIQLEQGEFVIIPKGIYHKPVAKSEAEVLLFEPETTVNTGNIDHSFTRNKLDRI